MPALAAAEEQFCAAHGGIETWTAVFLAHIAAIEAELKQYRMSAQLGCSVDAEVWHQLRMKMDAALGPDFDPYVRGDCFEALDAIVAQRDAALALQGDER